MKQSSQHPTDTDEWVHQKRSSKKKRRFGMKYRPTVQYWEKFYKNSNMSFRRLFWGEEGRNWRNYFRWYETAEDRDKAMFVLSRQKMYNDSFASYEFKPIER